MPTDEMSLLELVNALLSRWRIVIGLPLAVALVVAAISLMTPATYTATTTFVAERRTQSRLPSGLAGLAGEFGIALQNEPTESPRFYATVLKSREMSERILLSKYQDPARPKNDRDSTTLLRILNVDGGDAADSLHNGVKALDKMVSVRVDNQTNIVRLNVDAHYPGLAAAIANRFVGYLNDFNTKTRQSRVRDRRRFVEERLASSEHELRTAEEGLRTFYERNRNWQQSPQLAFEEGRLRRQVEIRQGVYLTLTREHETARIEEVNDTPAFTVIDPAVSPRERSRPRRTMRVVLALVVGTMFSVPWALASRYLERMRRENDPAYHELTALLQRARRALGRAAQPPHS